MVKTLFDIIEYAEEVDWRDCHLIMEVGRHNFSFAILNSNKKVLRLCFHELDSDPKDLSGELEELIGSEDLLKKNMKEIVVLYNFPENHIIPEKYFHINTNQELIEMLHGDLNKGVILSEKIQGWNQYNVFRVPTDVHNLFQRRFANGKYWHFYSLWMECGQKQLTMSSEYLSVVFYPNRILVAALRNKELELLQSFSYQTAEDVSYFLLNICARLQLSPSAVPVKLAGMVDISSALYTEILKYFLNAELDIFPSVSSTPALQEYPSHFFSPLLKLAICVS